MRNTVERGQAVNNSSCHAYRITVCAKSKTESVTFRYLTASLNSFAALDYALQRFKLLHAESEIQRIFIADKGIVKQ